MKSLLTILILCSLCLAAFTLPQFVWAQNTPTVITQPIGPRAGAASSFAALDPKDLENQLTKWAALAMTMITLLATLVTYAIVKVHEVRGSVNRNAARSESNDANLQKQVTAVAIATPSSNQIQTALDTLRSDSNPPPPVSAIIAAAGLFFLLSACATDTGDAAADRRGRVTNAALGSIARAVGSVALSTLTNAATQQLAGEKVDLAHSASAGLWSGLGTIVDAQSVQSVINAWSGGDLKPVAAVAAQKFAEVNPQTPAEKATVVNTIATSISTVASTGAVSATHPPAPAPL